MKTINHCKICNKEFNRHTYKTVPGRGTYCSNWKQMYKPEDAVLHHIDGNIQNNGFDNLCVISRKDHARIHMEVI